jgi:hypothetical protein
MASYDARQHDKDQFNREVCILKEKVEHISKLMNEKRMAEKHAAWMKYNQELETQLENMKIKH